MHFKYQTILMAWKISYHLLIDRSSTFLKCFTRWKTFVEELKKKVKKNITQRSKCVNHEVGRTTGAKSLTQRQKLFWECWKCLKTRHRSGGTLEGSQILSFFFPIRVNVSEISLKCFSPSDININLLSPLAMKRNYTKQSPAENILKGILCYFYYSHIGW